MENLLNEYVEIVQRMTDENDHTGAIAVMAQYVTKKHKGREGVEILIAAAGAVATLHSFYGHMPTHLNIARDEVAERIESFMTPEEVKAFQGAR